MKIAIIITLILTSQAAARADAVSLTRDEARQALANAAAAFDEGVRHLQDDRQRVESALRTAIAGYQSIIDSGVENGRLYYNIGNAYLILNDTGRAILNYRRAQEFIPSDPNLQANLAEAQARVRAEFTATPQVTATDRLRAGLRRLPMSSLFVLTLIAWCVGWAALGLRLRLRAIPRSLAFACLTLSLVGAGALLGDAWLRSTDQRAIVIAAETVGRKGPDEIAYAPSFAAPLPAGVELRVIDERPNWSLVRLPDGRETWTRAEDIERL